ncbi:hypothetical protein BC827DRAFT_641618 [Russula dissimulans]|nr:hypothetical protein BC827DRAFT_641618 [Russula dissimulans]
MSQYIYLMTAHLIHRIVISPRFPASFPQCVSRLTCPSTRRPARLADKHSGVWCPAYRPHFLFHLARKRCALQLLIALPLHLTVRTPSSCCTWSPHPYSLIVILPPFLYAYDLICPPWSKTCVTLSLAYLGSTLAAQVFFLRAMRCTTKKVDLQYASGDIYIMHGLS